MGKFEPDSARFQPPVSFAPAKGRVDWVDYAKGICIILVVLLHTTWGVENEIGRTSWMSAVSDFATPFRMPDFFLISGLFLGRTIHRDRRLYFDRKVVHFAYFYVLWITIQFVLKAPSFAGEVGWPGVLRMYLFAYIQPFAMMWFIYLLPVFYIVTRLVRNVPPLLIFSAAAVLEMAPIHTGWVVLDEFAWRYVYFFTGYWLAPYIFTVARTVQARPILAAGGLSAWAVVNSSLVAGGHSTLPVVSLVLGFAGAGAVIAMAALLAEAGRAPFLRYSGEHSIVIYLAFFLPMAASRTVLLKTNVIEDPGAVILVVAAVAVVGPLILHRVVRDTPAAFLFSRPRMFRLVPDAPGKPVVADIEERVPRDPDPAEVST